MQDPQLAVSLCSTATMQTVRVGDTNEVEKLIFRESENDREVVLQLEKKLFNYINQDVFRENNGTLFLQFDRELSCFKERLHELEIAFPPRSPLQACLFTQRGVLCAGRMWVPIVPYSHPPPLSHSPQSVVTLVAMAQLWCVVWVCFHSYPYSEDSSQGKQYMDTRCPAWCDRVLMSATAKDLVLKAATQAFGRRLGKVLERGPSERQSEPENEDKNLVYDNIGSNVCMGDHKPVYLSFRLTAGAGKPNANKHKCCNVQ
ncbi:unnamed protein product [Coregonus sp. 'balchen']|nr:unnamed protein product [Coregonus sp. 'balchen']